MICHILLRLHHVGASLCIGVHLDTMLYNIISHICPLVISGICSGCLAQYERCPRCPVIAANGACRIMIKAKGTHCSPSGPLCSECARLPQSTVCLSAMSRLDISAAAAPLCYSKKQEGACCADSFLFLFFLLLLLTLSENNLSCSDQRRESKHCEHV